MILSTFGDEVLQNDSKNGPMVPRTDLGCPPTKGLSSTETFTRDPSPAAALDEAKQCLLEGLISAFFKDLSVPFKDLAVPLQGLNSALRGLSSAFTRT
jgi:hypothetical protein